MSLVFGPVLSRRLGNSLGIDLLKSVKICSFDCLYCEVGKTKKLLCEQFEFKDFEKLESELLTVKNNLNKKLDFVTFAGSGEPTLASNLPEIAKFIRRIFPTTKIALLTNCSFLNEKTAKEFDLIVPKLDTVIQETFKKLNKPCSNITIELIKDNLIKASSINPNMDIGVLLVKNINDNLNEAKEMLKFLKTIKFNKLQIGTIHRLPAYDVKEVEQEVIDEWVKFFKNNGIYAEDIKYVKLDDCLELNFQNLYEYVKIRPVPMFELQKAFKISYISLIKFIEKYPKFEIINKEGINYLKLKNNETNRI